MSCSGFKEDVIGDASICGLQSKKEKCRRDIHFFYVIKRFGPPDSSQMNSIYGVSHYIVDPY